MLACMQPWLETLVNLVGEHTFVNPNTLGPESFYTLTWLKGITDSDHDTLGSSRDRVLVPASLRGHTPRQVCPMVLLI